MARMQRSLFAQLNALAEEISQGAVKAASEKSAGPVPADPGGYQGASSHPTTSVDNNVRDAATGARASEYEADVKKQQGPLAVDNAPEMSQEGRQDEVQLNINTKATAVGEDPSVEKDYKGDKDDPGTTHPAKTNDGEKYSSVTFKTAREACGNLGNDILANLINFGTARLSAEKAAEMPAALAAAQSKSDCDDDDDDDDDHKGHSQLKGDQHKLDVDNDGKIEGGDLAKLRGDKAAAYNAGYELAAQLGVEKSAAEAAVREVCANTLREADEMADLLIGFLTTKRANDDALGEASEGEDHDAAGDEASGAGDAPVAAGADEAAALAGADPAAGGDMGGMGGMEGEPSEDEAVQELAMALEELGIPPEALLEAVQSGALGGEGGGAEIPAEAAAPGMDAAPKMAADRQRAQALTEVGSAVINFKRSGKFQIKEARTKRSRQLRDIMKQHVIELVNR